MTADEVCALLMDAGACAAGVCNASPVPQSERRRLLDWLARGCHGSMDYLERNSSLAFDPATLLEGTRSVVSAAFAYAPADPGDRHPLFADYARGADYHKALKKRLRPVAHALEGAVAGSRTRICVDTAPVRERFWAAAAGVGHMGLNGQLLVPSVGCGVFLAEILWTAEVSGAADIPDQAPEAACLQCGACVRACPAGALDGRGGLDAARCLSYLTIEHRGDLPDGLRLPARLYGCDVCRDVCPQNRAVQNPLPEFRLRPALAAVTPASMAAMTPEGYDALTAGSAIRRAPLAQLMRNLKKRP